MDQTEPVKFINRSVIQQGTSMLEISIYPAH